MQQSLTQYIQEQTQTLSSEGLFKQERPLFSPQDASIAVESGRQVINLCANNYLGLANSPRIIQAAKQGLDSHGFGMASVRFICGTQDIHQELETALSTFLQTEDTILYSSCFDANTGLFETLLSDQDAVISDALNHASVIDGIRLCKAKRFRYKNNDMQDLENTLCQAQDAGSRFILIATDGVFSMDGIIADLQAIVTLAKKYNALVMVDDSHAVGFLGEKGRGSHEYCDVVGEIDLLTGTLGKALGGASGGYTSGRKELITWLRQRSRPYLFSNALAPAIVRASLAVLELLQEAAPLRKQLHENSVYFRKNMEKLGFVLAGSDHPIIPVMIHDAALAGKMADSLLAEGIYVTGFSFPVVPRGQARIRTQMSAAHTKQHLDQAITAFEKTGHELGVLS